MSIEYTSIAVTRAEQDRVNAALAAGASATQALAGAQASLASAQAELSDAVAELVSRAALIAALQVENDALRAALGAVSRQGLYVDGRYLRTKQGSIVQIRGIELMYGPGSAGNPALSCDVCCSFGANSIAPLYQPWLDPAYNPANPGALDLTLIRTRVAAHLEQARARGIVVLFNPDHIPEAVREAFLFHPQTIALLESYDNVILSLGVESYETSEAAWFAARQADITAVRNAGYTCPIKISSPQGGRAPRYALNRGAELLSYDPLHSLIFTWQAYWKTITSGWQYSQDQGFPSAGTAGALECAAAVIASGLCFIVGLDGRDNIGLTPYQELAAALHAGGVGWQWWVLNNDQYGNSLVSSALSDVPSGEFGAAVKALLQAQSVLPAL